MRALPVEGRWPATVRVRALLKIALRRFRLQCVRLSEPRTTTARRKKTAPRIEPPRPMPRPVVELTAVGVKCGWCGYPYSGGCVYCYLARRQYEESRQKDKP
jgi:hypothetical protein